MQQAFNYTKKEVILIYILHNFIELFGIMLTFVQFLPFLYSIAASKLLNF